MSDYQYDMVIRGGSIVDGSGGAPVLGDVAVSRGVIAAMGIVDGCGREEIDARGLLVTPGFVDVHTHYDGQATWEHRLAPSSGHGVTTVVTGNCGVGFAPVRPGDQGMLIKVMEGVEDIPEVVMAEGIPWNWESFPDYLDALGARQYDIDIAVQLAHSPLRVYVMGNRGANHEPSTEADRVLMKNIVTDAIRAGAIGVTTSRSLGHRLKDGTLAPSVTSAGEELLSLAQGLRAAGDGVFQLITNVRANPRDEMDLVQKIAEVSGRPVAVTLLQAPRAAEDWRVMLAALDQANARGLEVRGQVFPRPVGVLYGLDLSLHPFVNRPSYRAIAGLPLAQRVAAMRDSAFRGRLLAEDSIPDPQPMVNELLVQAAGMFVLDDPVDYAPPPHKSIGARAAAAGISVETMAYDLLLQNDGQNIFYLPAANFVSGTLDAARVMMAHPHTILALGDGGAHYGFICDASFTTYVLTHWARDVAPEQRFPIEWAIAALCRKPALSVGLRDRGLIAPGMKADLNVIDHARLKLYAPRTVHDLPANGRRLRQRADGYVATIVSGVVTYRDGAATTALPGRLVRGNGYRAADKAA